MTDKTLYDFSAKTIDGQDKPLSDYKGRVLLIVNTASRCGFTPQYAGLQKLYETYHERGFDILGFPCNQFMNQEPGSDKDIQDFCTLNFGVTFPLFQKIDVNGPNAHPLYTYLTSTLRGLLTRKIKWNFTKFLVDRQGQVVKRFAPVTTPDKIAADIESLL